MEDECDHTQKEYDFCPICVLHDRDRLQAELAASKNLLLTANRLIADVMESDNSFLSEWDKEAQVYFDRQDSTEGK